MTFFTRWLRRLYDKLRGRFYEGPKAPERLNDQVLLFSMMYPNATRLEWTIFCQRLAAQSYQSGWIRGYEWAERELDTKPEFHPDRLADALGNDWRHAQPLSLHNPHEPVTDVPVEPINTTEVMSNERRYFEERVGRGPSR